MVANVTEAEEPLVPMVRLIQGFEFLRAGSSSHPTRALITPLLARVIQHKFEDVCRY
jgi:hypothetical protein